MKNRHWPRVAALSFVLSSVVAGATQAQPATYGRGSRGGRSNNGQFAPRVFVNGQTLRSDAQPFTEGGRVLVPMRAIFERLDAQLRYNPEDQSVVARRRSTTVRLTLGSRQASVNNLNVTLDVPAASYRGRTFVPLRFVAEALGANVRYDFERQAVFIRERGAGGFRGASAADDGADLNGPGDNEETDRPAVHLPTHRVSRPGNWGARPLPDENDNDRVGPDEDTNDYDPDLDRPGIENPGEDDPGVTPERDRYPRRNRPQPEPERYPERLVAG